MRTLKVKQKISGSYRTCEGTQCIAGIRSQLSTIRKQTRQAVDACYQGTAGQHCLPSLPKSDATT